MAGRDWTAEEEEYLLAQITAGKKYKVIAAALNRTICSINAKACNMGKVRLERPKPDIRPLSAMRVRSPTIRSCQWPIGEPGKEGFHFCGKPALAGKPYCGLHVKKAHGRG